MHNPTRPISTRFPTTVHLPTESPFQILKPGNSKLGRGFVRVGRWEGKTLLALTLVERETCPKSCHHWNDCYGNNMYRAHRWSTRTAEERRALEARIEQEIKWHLEKRPGGLLIRLHVLGDFYSVSYVRFWARLLRENPKLAVFGYTAHPPKSAKGKSVHALLNLAYPNQSLIRFSQNQEGTEDISSPRFAGEEGFQGASFPCPEQTGALPSCLDCGLCWHLSVTKTVTFKTH